MFRISVCDRSTMDEPSTIINYEIQGLQEVCFTNFIKHRYKDNYRYGEFGLRITATDIDKIVEYKDVNDKTRRHIGKCYQVDIPYHHCTVKIQSDIDEPEVWNLNFQKTQMLLQKLSFIAGLESV